MRRDETESEISKRTAQLSGHITHYLDVVEQKQQFAGPSLYFHHKTIQCLGTLGLSSAGSIGEEYCRASSRVHRAWVQYKPTKDC
jgi:hypothetical protein